MKLTFKRIIGILAIVFLGVFILNSLLSYMTNRRYSQIIANSELIEAFTQQDEAKMKLLAAQNDLDYEILINGKISYASRPGLPLPPVIKFQSTSSPDVLPKQLQTSLRTLVPHRFLINNSLYLAIPLCKQSCSDGLAIIYSKIAP